MSATPTELVLEITVDSKLFRHPAQPTRCLGPFAHFGFVETPLPSAVQEVINGVILHALSVAPSNLFWRQACPIIRRGKLGQDRPTQPVYGVADRWC